MLRKGITIPALTLPQRTARRRREADRYVGERRGAGWRVMTGLWDPEMLLQDGVSDWVFISRLMRLIHALLS